MPVHSRFCILTACGAAMVASRVFAQVDASWIGPAAFVNEPVFATQPGPVNVLNQGHDWTHSPDWSVPPFPSNSGAATIAAPGRRDSQGRIIITLDADVTLRELSLANTAGVDITDTQPALNAMLHAAPQGLLIRATRYHPDAPSRAAYLYGGNRIAVPITGSGAVSVSGPGLVSFTRANSFAGPLSIAEGILAIAGDPDSRLGVSPTPVTLDAGTIRSGAPGVISRAFWLGGGGGTFAVSSSSPLELIGGIGGEGALRLEDQTLRLSAENTYTGTTVVRGENLVIGGSIRFSSWIDTTGIIQLSRTALTPNVDRIGDSAPITMRGGTLAIEVDDPLPCSEAVGTITAAGGTSTIRFVGGAPLSLASPALIRQDRAAIFVDGPRIGTGASALTFGNGPGQLRGAGDASGTSQSIIPWMWGYAGGESAYPNGVGRGSLITYGAGGARPLDLAAEYRQTLAGATVGENVRITSSQSVGSTGHTINALLMGSSNNADNGTPSSLTGGPITITSGAILNTTRGNTIFNNVEFGEAEGVIISASTAGSGGDQGLIFWGAISGTNGLTKHGPGNLFLGGASSYSGTTTIGSGRVTIIDDVVSLAPGPFGQSDAPIVLVAGGTRPGATEPGGATRLANQRGGGSLTIGRPIVVRGATHARAPGAIIDSTSDAGIVNITGGIDLQSPEAPLAVTRGSVIFNSSLRGPGSLRDSGTATLIFAAQSPLWSGGVEMGLTPAAATYLLAAEHALGTGTVYIGSTAATTIRGTGPSRSLSNPIVFALGASGSAVTFDGDLRLTGPLDFGGNIGRPIVVPEQASLALGGSVANGSFRLLAATFGNSSDGGTLTIQTATDLDGRIFLGAPAYGAVPGPTAGGTLRIVHNNALGSAGVQVDADRSTLQLDGAAGPLAVTPTNAFVRGSGVNANGAVFNSAGDNIWGGNIALIADAAIGVWAGSTLHVEGTLADLSAATPGFGNAALRKSGGGTLRVKRLANGSLANGAYAGSNSAANALDSVIIGEGAIVVEDLPGTLRGDQVSVVRNLSIGPAALLDLADTALVIDYDGSSPSAAIDELVRAAFAGGSWSGPGLTSAAAAAQSGRTGLALVESSSVFPDLPAQYLGQQLDADALIVAYTLAGDATIDGEVSLEDFALLAANFNSPGGWAQGDSDYDQLVSLGDFARLAQNFNAQLSTVAARTVPEAGVNLLLFPTIAYIVARRQR